MIEVRGWGRGREGGEVKDYLDGFYGLEEQLVSQNKLF